MTYEEFLKGKIDIAEETGIVVEPEAVNPALKPHQRDAVLWGLKGGRRALFERFGLGKTGQQLEWARLLHERTGVRVLIVCPLGVKQEFQLDAVRLLGWEAPPPYVRTDAEAAATDAPIVLTNYERVRDGDINPKQFGAVSLDEASCLRSYGSKTYQQFLTILKGIPYKLVCTATPSPNRYKELIHYSGYLEIMDTGSCLTKWFQRDSTKANKLTLYPHREKDFWLWMSSWALFIEKPSDLGYDDTGYDLPEMEIRWHRLAVDNTTAGADKHGQMKLIRDAAFSLQDAAKEKRDSIDDRVAKMASIVESDPEAHFILWHDLEAERHAIKKAIPEAVEVYGSQEYDVREQRVIDFSDGKIRLLATKKSISGQGCNFQRYCHRAIFLGIDYEFNDFIQAIHRIYRFLQTEKVIIDIIYTESEEEIKKALMEKWQRHDEMMRKMTEIVRKYGLVNVKRFDELRNTMGVKRVEVNGKHYRAINNDCVDELARMDENSVDEIVTSIPFGNHYQYSNNYNDFGMNQDDEDFFRQMDFLTPNLLRVLKPGRVYACHVKDRVLFGNATGTGMPTMEPFHALTIQHTMKHGFQYFGMITVVTDVVRENNQTYRLGWSEQCKDGSKMGVGCPEYILLFRKLPTDTSKAYADEPVVKTKEEYTRAQWQIDAHAYWRSSGDRLVTKEELYSIPTSQMQKVYRRFSRGSVYSYEDHVALAKQMDKEGRLPATFMVVAPGSWTTDVWDDVNRMKTFNTSQKLKKRMLHVCLAEGTLVLTRNGYKPIETVEIGDVVLTHTGNWKPVIARAYTGMKDTVMTRATGVPNLITTPDHKLWTRSVAGYPSRPKDGMRKAQPDWMEAKDTVGHFVNLKLPEIEATDLTLGEWWLVGRYLADGHVGTRGDFFISVGKEKRGAFEEMAGLDYIGTFADRGSCLQYRLKGLPERVKRMLEKCGRGAANKQVPIKGICLDADHAEALLSGYLSGDGCKAGNATMATSVSRALLLGMAMVAQRARGVVASVFAGKAAGKRMIEGREVDCKQEWVMSWRESGHHSESEILADGAWKKVKVSVPMGLRRVYSIQVADDASFTAEGCIVKNCPLQIDIVDRLINRYSNPGDVVLDPFGGIMTVPTRAVALGRFGVGVELNSDYFRDGLGYLQQADDQAGAPTLFDFIGENDGDEVDGEQMRIS